MTNPKISVIMSVYNGEKYLREAIESILNQTFTDFEFIIVNDGSTDNSLDIIQSYGDERIKIINNEKNIGLTKSLNKALKVARGEYISRQDADDISLPNRFEEQIKYLEKHPEVALLGTSIYRIDKDGEITGKSFVARNPSKKLFTCNQFTHGTVMFKKEVVNKLGQYNELLKYSQDYELWLRIAKQYVVRNLTQILYKLRSHSENIWSKKVEETALYRILTLRLASDELDEAVLKAIKDSSIKILYSHLSKSEKKYFHKALANMHMQNNNIHEARKECENVFALNPFDIENNINFLRLHLGKDIQIISAKIYRNFRNILQYLENCLSK